MSASRPLSSSFHHIRVRGAERGPHARVRGEEVEMLAALRKGFTDSRALGGGRRVCRRSHAMVGRAGKPGSVSARRVVSARWLVAAVAASLCLLGACSAVTAPVAFAEACPNEAARSGPSASLPECRAYEMVTPTNKSTIVQDLSFAENETAISAVNGERIALYTHIEGFGQTPGAFESMVDFTRTPSGWQTESAEPPGSGGEYYKAGAGQSVFTPDLTEVALKTNDENLFPRSPFLNLRVGPWGGPYTTMATVPTGPTSNSEEEAGEVLGATPSFSSVFFDSDDPSLAGSTVETVEGAGNVYRWEPGGLSVVDVNADGSPVSTCGAQFEAVSADGSKVFFTTPSRGAVSRGFPQSKLAEASCEQPVTLYMREGGSIVEISKGLGAVHFEGASQDGSRVFFVLGGPSSRGELYVYDTLTSKLTDVTPGVVTGSVFPSQDGVRVYFQADAKLTTEAPEGLGMYRYNTETGETHFITNANVEYGAQNYSGEVEGDGGTDMRLSPNGRYLIYYGGQTDPLSEKQVYLYDDENEQVTCVSCLPSGAPLDKASELGSAQFPRLFTVLHTDDLTPPETFVANDGAVFFESTTQLVPRAVNATGGSTEDLGKPEEDLGLTYGTVVNDDVYEWHDGVVSLISSPTDPFAQYLLGVSEDGSNVFFVTHSQLVPQDIDNAGDIYDARVDGGFPPVVASAACEGDTCVHLPPALNDPTPGSLSFTGPGNPRVKVLEPKAGTKSKRCARGKVRKGGKCVRSRGRAKAVRRGVARRAARGMVKHDRGGSR
jgi:hypothetical protein